MLSDTPNWSVDSQASPSPFVNAAATGNTVSGTSNNIDLSDPSLAGAVPHMALFQSERFDNSGSPEMQWNFPVTAGGTYEVRLFFAEIYSGAQSVGVRVFDVLIEGAVVLNHYDIYADVGGYKGVMKSFTVSSDSNLTIDFHHVIENPAIKGIEIRQLGSNPGVLGALPSNLDFGSVTAGTSATRTVQLTNLGGSGDPSITVSSASVTGANAVNFSSNFAPVTLTPGQSATVTATFSPPSGATGAKSATLGFAHNGASTSPLTVPLTGNAVTSLPVSFGKSILQGVPSLNNPTSLQFGPDDRLYVAEQNGLIRAYSITRAGPNAYSVTASETINLINSIPNHDDNGNPNTSVNTRLVTGILVTGTPNNPVIYATSSDPRIGGGPSGADLNLDTNSGMISRLTWNGTQWVKLDLVRGLPRSEENHAPNGLVLDSVNNYLYVPTGGNTNHGAPSNNFGLTPEYALSTALLQIDLAAIGQTTYDLPTLDDEDRPGVNDVNDPFGGNDGKNQAKLVPGGPVKVYASGFRNAYDAVMTGTGANGPQFWTIDNGGNSGWGDIPIGEGPGGNCTNGINEPGVTDQDQLHFVSGPGLYFGHPNPTRGNIANTFNASNPQSPVTFSNLEECNYLAPVTEDGAFTTFPASTNGLTQYQAGNFGGSMDGNLLAAGFDNKISRLVLNASATAMISKETLFSTVGSGPLDVNALDDTGVFPGTIWVADHGANTIIVFEPADFDGGGTSCTGADNPALDEDNDGYSNADEIDNGTNPCSAADVPPDWDNDFISNLNDPDDDNDGLNDTIDPFAIDPANGAATNLPVLYTWENDAPKPGGLLDLGFTGLMTNHTANYESLFDPAGMTAGGAAGVVTVDAVPACDAFAANNNQKFAFQFGVNVNQSTAVFTAHTRIVSPFAGLSPKDFQSIGLFIGNGDQDNYFKLLVSANGGLGGIESAIEIAGNFTNLDKVTKTMPGPNSVDLYLTVDPAVGTVQARYSITTGGTTSQISNLGSAEPIPPEWLTGSTKLAVGIISTSFGSGSPFPATWDFIEVAPPWVSLSPLPVALGEVAGGIIGNNMYMVGEGNNATLKYDFSADTWNTQSVRPFVGNHHAAEVVNDKLYLIGGLGGGSEGQVQIYDPSLNTWSTAAPAPFASGSAATAVIGGKIYYAGGIVGSATVNSVAAYDLATNTWSAPLNPMPQGVNHAAAATDGNKLYVFGGRTGGNTVSNGFNYVQIYDPLSNTWTSSTDSGSTLAPLPQARGGMGKAVFYNNEFYIIGGETLDGAGATSNHVYNRVDIYNPVTNTWRVGLAMPTARHGIFPLLHLNRVYIAGGGVTSGNSQSTVFERYEP